MRRCNSTTCMALGLLGPAMAWGCGTEPTPPVSVPVSVPISVTVSPPTVSMATGGSQSFSATVANDPSANGVTWSIAGCTGGAAVCGSLTNITNTTATYAAPATVPSGAVGVRATSVSDNTKSFTAAVAITVTAANGQIAFVRTREIYVVNADGSGQVNLTNNPATVGQLTWSPDGARIAFVSDRDGNFEIYVMRADGSNQVNLSNNAALDVGPAWSPDGTKIAFSSDRDGPGQMYVGPFQIYVMNADGSGLRNLTNNPAADGGAAWRPQAILQRLQKR